MYVGRYMYAYTEQRGKLAVNFKNLRTGFNH